MSFTSLGVAPMLIAKLQEMSIGEPLPIQNIVIPKALEGNNLLANSQTGSGKTLAYLLPVIQSLSADINSSSTGARALILAPTRELAQQIASVCAPLCDAVELSHCVIVGGVEYDPQRVALASNPDIIIATPGRLVDLIEQGAATNFNLDFFVLDEVDQMVDLGFRDTIIKLYELRREGSRSLFFSATLSDQVVDIVSQIEPAIERVAVEGQSLAVDSIEHFGYYVSFEMMDRLLIHLLRIEAPEQAIIFTRSRKMADRIVGLLSQNSITAEAMHSDRSQAAREHILSRFRSGETSIIVATDVIARGIDIDSVTHVFNFGLPLSEEQYIHRCGRVGRVGRSGKALSLFTPEERPMVNAICRLMRRHIIIDESHPYVTPDVTLALSGNSPKKKKGRR